MVLLIEENDVKKVLTFEDTLKAVEDAYRQYGLGKAGGNSLIYGNPPPPRCEMRVKGKNLPHLSPEIRNINQTMAYLEESNLIFLRWNFHLGEKKGYISYLIDARDGEILAVIKADASVRSFMGFMRVGAAGAIGAKYLSLKNSKVAGVIGTGRVGKTLLHFLTKVRDIELVYAHSGRKKDDKYAKEMSDKLNIDIIPCNNLERIVNKSDIIMTATKSTIPIIEGKWIHKGTHINAFGADCPFKTELDTLTLQKADKLVIDYYLALDTKELRIPLLNGLLKKENIYANIGEIVAGLKPGREKSSEITIFKNTGMTLPYVTITKNIYEKVINMGLGKEINNESINLMYY